MINLLMKTGYPFASFRFPGEQEFINIVQTEKEPVTYDPGDMEKVRGFLFSPFDPGGDSPHFLIRHDLSYTWNAANPPNAPMALSLLTPRAEEPPFPGISKDDYLQQIHSILQKIKNGEAQKVVLSRPQVIPLPGVFDFTAFFAILHRTYPDAFIFLIFLPGRAIWAGASPELFLRRSSTYLETMALAGTLPINGKGDIPLWTDKERKEQQIVTDYIMETLHTSGTDPAEVSVPHTVFAGQVAHLQTSIRIPYPGVHQKISRLISVLHPTPAICGYPKQAALEIIRQTETYNREYYTGFLGPWNTRYPSQLYINLRSMQFLPSSGQAVLYAGGGITADSDPEKEWTETGMKLNTLLSVLKKMSNFAG